MKSKRTHKRTRQIRCPYCGSIAVIRSAADIYQDPKRKDKLYVCSNYPACGAYVGMNPITREPYGSLADGDLRHLRIRAHRLFDQLWQKGVMSRNDAYRWLADYFNLPLRDAHIGMFSEYRCGELIRKCEELLSFQKKGLLARGDIELTVADYNAIEKELRTRLEDKFDTVANGQKADDLALKMVKEVYEPIVKAIDRKYDVIVEFK